MTYFYSPSKDGFYADTFHKTMPDDVIKITDLQHSDLLEGQANGKDIKVINGHVLLVDRENKITWDQIRSKRDLLMAKTDWSQLKDVSEDKQKKYQAYRQALRDIPQNFLTPESVVWPDPSRYGI